MPEAEIIKKIIEILSKDETLLLGFLVILLFKNQIWKCLVSVYSLLKDNVKINLKPKTKIPNFDDHKFFTYAEVILNRDIPCISISYKDVIHEGRTLLARDLMKFKIEALLENFSPLVLELKNRKRDKDDDRHDIAVTLAKSEHDFVEKALEAGVPSVVISEYESRTKLFNEYTYEEIDNIFSVCEVSEDLCIYMTFNVLLSHLNRSVTESVRVLKALNGLLAEEYYQGKLLKMGVVK